jgi:hypothetical protein
MKTEIAKTSNLSKRKVNGYNSSILRMKRKQKRADAEARQVAWEELTPTEQMNSLKGRRGASARQVARIQASLKS